MRLSGPARPLRAALWDFPQRLSQALPVIDIDLNGSLFESAGLARTVIGPVCLLSYRAVPPGVQETAI